VTRTLDDVLPAKGWELGLRHRARVVQGRGMVQAPTETERRMVAAVAGAAKVEGIPMDVLMTLEAIRQLAEQGNRVAARLYEEERRKLGIDRPIFSVAD
jgi:hypothetical protein